MSLDRGTLETRIRVLFEAAEHTTADPGLVGPLVASTGLSREGVELALREHVERDLDRALSTLTEWHLPQTPDTTVILAANVFVATFRAIVFAALGGERVWVRASRREPVFAAAYVHNARARGATWLALDAGRDLSTLTGAIHVYGREDTVRAVREGVRSDVSVYAHGPGFSAAWVPATEPEVVAAAARLADDIVPFDQRGCLSPRVVFVEGEARALSFASALHEHLAERERTVPRGILDDSERVDWNRALDTWTMAGLAVHEAPAHQVVVAPADAPLALAPVGRAMHVVPVQSGEHVSRLLEPVSSQLVALACDHGTLPGFARTRRSVLGRLQKPPMDGPVDLRVR